MIGVDSLSLNKFSESGAVGTDTLVFEYIGTTNVSTPFIIGQIVFDATGQMPPPATPPGDITITYYDHKTGGTNTGMNVYTPTVVPEPSSVALLALGAVSGLYLRKRLARRAA